MTADKPFSLLDGDPGTRQQWEAAAAAVLRKGHRLAQDAPDSDVWGKLARTTLDGIAVTPLGTPELVADLDAPVRPDRLGAWEVRALVLEPDADAAHDAAMTDLDNGVTSLWVKAGPGGIPVADLEAALKGVLLDVAPVVLDAGGDVVAAAETLERLAKQTKVDLRSNLGIDTVGAHVREEPFDEQAVSRALEIAQRLGIRAFVVDGTAVHDQGATDAQELGYVLAAAVHHLRALERHGVEPAAAATLVEFRLSATDEQFPTIAKLRAVRRLWARVLELSGVDEEQRGMLLHAVTSRPMMSKYDPWVNMLRSTVAAFAAGVGGADSVTVLPFDAPLGLPDAFSRRNARNISSLLIEESHLAKVTDPAGGAYAVERLTEDLARAGWAEFGRIESEGDIFEAWPALKARVEESAARRDADVAQRKRPLTGVSEFPNLSETLPQRKPYPDGAPAVRRYGHAFEELRDRPATTPVFLATMGTVAAHTARATFASNLLAAGGIGVVNTGPHEDVKAVVADYGQQPVVCLVGNDQAYAEWGAELVGALRKAGATYVIVAGKPGDLGVDDSCAMGMDALDFLHRTRDQLEGERA